MISKLLTVNHTVFRLGPLHIMLQMVPGYELLSEFIKVRDWSLEWLRQYGSGDLCYC